jgi:hypothetical protein
VGGNVEEGDFVLLCALLDKVILRVDVLGAFGKCLCTLVVNVEWNGSIGAQSEFG